MNSRVTHIARFSVQDWRTSRVRSRSAISGDPFLRVVYIEILFALYEMGGSLPSDPQDLSDILMVPADEVARCLPILAEFGRKGRGGVVLRDDGTLVNARVSDDLASLRTYLDGQAACGRRGGKMAGKGRPKGSSEAPIDGPGGAPPGVPGRTLTGSREDPEPGPENGACACGNPEEKTPVFRREKQGLDRGSPNLPRPKPMPKAKEPPPSGGGLRGRAGGAGPGPPEGAAAAACRRMVEAVERAWSAARGAGALPLAAAHRLALEGLAARGAPPDVIAAKVAEVVARQAVAGHPVSSFGYLVSGGALEEAFESWREGQRPEDRLDSSLLDGYRLMRIEELRLYLAGRYDRLAGRVVPRAAAERALERLRLASSAGEVEAVMQALAKSGREADSAAAAPGSRW